MVTCDVTCPAKTVPPRASFCQQSGNYGNFLSEARPLVDQQLPSSAELSACPRWGRAHVSTLIRCVIPPSSGQSAHSQKILWILSDSSRDRWREETEQPPQRSGSCALKIDILESSRLHVGDHLPMSPTLQADEEWIKHENENEKWTEMPAAQTQGCIKSKAHILSFIWFLYTGISEDVMFVKNKQTKNSGSVYDGQQRSHPFKNLYSDTNRWICLLHLHL